MEDYIYNDIVKKISMEFVRQLQEMESIYNFDYGDEFEIAVCKILRKILPLKYGVCRGFVVNKDGDTAGDDIIIYDRNTFPTLRFLGAEDDYSRKNQIPVESVYAYIEAKNTFTSESIEKAVEQTIKVKKLCYSRTLIPIVDRVSGLHIFNNSYSRKNGWNPIISNPVYTMIIGNRCFNLAKKVAKNGKEAESFLLKIINDDLKLKFIEETFYSPDSMIAGDIATVFSGHWLFNADGSKKSGVQLTRFHTGIVPMSCYQVNEADGNAYGLGMAHLMMALNYIRLGDMPWDMIFNTAKMPNKVERQFWHDQLP